MGRATLACMLLLAALMNYQAGAQIPSSNSELRATPGPQDGRRLALSEFQSRKDAACVVKRAGVIRIVNLLNTTPESHNERKLHNSLQSRMDWCLEGTSSVGFTFIIWRGFLAGQLIDMMESKARNDAIAHPLTSRDWIYDFGDQTKGNAGLVGFAGLGRCVAAASPSAVLELVQSIPFSIGEARAFDRIKPAIAPCMDSGITGEFSPQSLRATVTEGLYHFLRASGVSLMRKGQD